ncbi:MAG: aminotransferase class I/II-fold pyridoxal phosphate-dependent enzyme [Deltaproteobacteria bacterium]|nr:aminotransferase class I/II-fold pyridoxal phosphate-dependent enzyme [Deltaproteobacteria bacterium]
MEQVAALSERIRSLKQVAASMREGAIHTALIPEIDKVLALPDGLTGRTLGELEAVSRQIREYEQTFDALGYTLLDQLMPSTSVSSVFRVVQAKDSFRHALRLKVGQSIALPTGGEVTIDHALVEALTSYGLSIGTPPITDTMRKLVARTIFGRDVEHLTDFVEVLDPPDPASGLPVSLQHHQLLKLLQLLRELIYSSMHYNTIAEEQAFLRDATEFINFEGGRLFNRVVITESPKRVITLVERYLFDKFGPQGETPVHVVEGVDALGPGLIAAMQAEPNKVFVARITRLPHHLLDTADSDRAWLSVIGRLLLIDCSGRARQSNTTIIYTLFPHVAATLRNIQTSFAGRPANTQLALRQVLEHFSPDTLAGIGRSLSARLTLMEAEGALGADIDQIRAQEWTRTALFDYLVLKKVHRLVAFLERVARSAADEASAPPRDIARDVADGWMRYFYPALPRDVYRATVVPGGGRGALTLLGEHHRERTRALMQRFREESLSTCRERISQLKRDLAIPAASSDEIEAAIKQSQLRALSPAQWKVSDHDTSLTGHLARTMVYRAADTAERIADRTRDSVERAAFSNVTGAARAMVKRALDKRGFGALHSRLDDQLGGRLDKADRRLRDVLSPMQERIRQAQRSIANIKGELDPISVGEIDAMLNVIDQGHFYPTLILPAMSWTYHDVFPEKDFPATGTIHIPLNDHKEMDPLALLSRLEQLRYLFRPVPEVFELICQSVLIVLNTPHNPTGVVYRRQTVLQLLQIASTYGVTVLDDNAYHKIVTSAQKAQEGDACVAEIYETYRSQFTQPVRLVTVGATTKGLEGAGDRTGLLHANDPEIVDFVEEGASEPHLLSLYLTKLKLESGLAAKRYTRDVEGLAVEILDPTGTGIAPWQRLRALLTEQLSALKEDDFPVAVFETLLEGYERLLRLRQRGASIRHLSTGISELMRDLKHLRLERQLRTDIQQRVDQCRMALLRAGGQDPDPSAASHLGKLIKRKRNALQFITPQGAFYCCVRLCDPDDLRGLQEFLEAIAGARGIDFTAAGMGYVRISLGGRLAGDPKSYNRLGQTIEVCARLLKEYWERFEGLGRDSKRLPEIFCEAGEDPLARAISDLEPLLALRDPKELAEQGFALEPSERGIVYSIEEGRSVADKVFVTASTVCETVDELLQSQTFRVLYRRLLRKVYAQDLRLAELSYEQVENQYGPLACRLAYHDRQRIAPVFSDLLLQIYRAWHSASTVKTLTARLQAPSHQQKTAALQGINRRLNELINELLYAFRVTPTQITATSTFEVGYELLDAVTPHPGLPDYLKQVITGAELAGATTPLCPDPRVKTGAVKRVADHRYGFIRRDQPQPEPDQASTIETAPETPGLEDARVEGLGVQAETASAPELAFFQRRLAQFPAHQRLTDYVSRAVQVGPFRLLLVIHKSYFHLTSDELRLFPQIEAVQLRENLQELAWDGVLLFGVPSKLMGDGYKTGYIIDRYQDGSLLPTAWVAREDATDYTGFLKKSLLTLHNERVKALGGMPVHGAMVTITFKNGLRKTLVFSADSGTGKSETITAMMEQMSSGGQLAVDLERVDILAGDMLSLWRGVDEQIYAFGTETGDFMRLTDITESWQLRFRDLLQRGSYSNLDYAKNPRVTIPGICDRQRVLSPTRINGFFYINNYAASGSSSVEIIEDPHQLLKQVLVRGLRKNKGTSGDQPSLRAGLEQAGEHGIVTRFRYALDELLTWCTVQREGREHTCLVFRDGATDVYIAREVVALAFKGRMLSPRPGAPKVTISGVDHDVMENVFWLLCGNQRVLLDREAYDQVYEPLVSTFCGNPFVDPTGMEQTLGVFAETLRQGKIHTGVIKTQLARVGYEHSGPAKAAEDIVDFLTEDEEVNARFQRNKNKVRRAMEAAYGGLIARGTPLPVELEGYNLLLLEEHESTHVEFIDQQNETFTLSTPYYRFTAPPVNREATTPFRPAIALPRHIEAIVDICDSVQIDLPLQELEVELAVYGALRYWNTIEEFTYQVLLVNGVVDLGSSDAELARLACSLSL